MATFVQLCKAAWRAFLLGRDSAPGTLSGLLCGFLGRVSGLFHGMNVFDKLDKQRIENCACPGRVAVLESAYVGVIYRLIRYRIIGICHVCAPFRIHRQRRR